MLCLEDQIKNCATRNKEEQEKTTGNSVISTLLVNKKGVSASDASLNFQRQSFGQKASKLYVSQFQIKSVQLDFNVIQLNNAQKIQSTPSCMVTGCTYLLLHPMDTDDLWPFCHSPQPPHYCQQQLVAFSPGVEKQKMLLWTNWNFEKELF